MEQTKRIAALARQQRKRLTFWGMTIIISTTILLIVGGARYAKSTSEIASPVIIVCGLLEILAYSGAAYLLNNRKHMNHLIEDTDNAGNINRYETFPVYESTRKYILSFNHTAGILVFATAVLFIAQILLLRWCL